MKLVQEYHGMVGRLIKPAAQLLTELIRDHKKVDAVHALVGAGGEIGEIQELYSSSIFHPNRELLNKECGDLFFYLTAIRLSTGVFPDGELDERQLAFECPTHVALSVAVGNVIDTVKKWAIYNQPLDEERRATLGTQLTLAEGIVSLILVENLLTLEQCVRANMEKLDGPKGRYREGTYSDAAAESRRDVEDE